MIKRSLTLNIRWLLLGILVIILGIVSTKTAQANPAFDTKEGSMNLAYNLESKSKNIPPIDAAVTSVFETASFGLG